MSTYGKCLLVLAVSFLFSAASLSAESLAHTGASQTPEWSIHQVIEMLQSQQEELAAQRARLDAQDRVIADLTQELDTLRGAPGIAESTLAPIDTESNPVLEQERVEIDSMENVSNSRAVVASESGQKTAAEVKQAQVEQAQADDPTEDLLSSFPGAWRLPGTSAAFSIGGYIRTAIVLNEDVLEIPDRFIVGSIPVGLPSDGDNAAQSSVTANQSRLNFDMRESTRAGILRAFIEGDFTGDGDTFRLRHAFGQWDRVLAGQTWSAFVDTEATPESVDFEGLNGRINVRQSQVRFSPPIGDDFRLQFSLEDPNPQIQNGNGVTRVPDIVMAARFKPHERLHVRAAILGRQIRGQEVIPTNTPGGVEEGGVDKSYAWGFSLSGSFRTPLFDSRDKLLFQLNRGNGIGRYVNDLNSIGNFDGIFNPATNKLQLFNVFAGYGSLQHWWADTMRSNFTLGLVDVNNPEFVDGDAYKRTIRASANLLWNPTPRIDTGIEYLWGRRENKDGEDGDAQQIQMMVRYLF
ncbi:MAG: DcaP family trimeric outer membrane transporter [Pseudomonadota bacterium]